MTTNYFVRTLAVVVLSACAYWLVDDLQRGFSVPVAPGVDIPYLPAGIRLIAVVVFGLAGAVGLFVGALLALPNVFPDMTNPVVAIALALLNAAVAMLSLFLARRAFRIGVQLAELDFRRLLALVALQSVLSPLANQSFFAFTGIAPASLHNLLGMVVGDVTGSMLTLLVVALAWGLWRRR